MKIRNIEQTDIPLICKSYKNTFPDEHFSVHFPVKLLEKYFTDLINSFEINRILVSDDDTILGYLIGGKHPNPVFNSFIKRNLLGISLVFIRHPKFIIEKAVELYNSFSESEDLDKNTLCLIAIDQNSQGMGLGMILINDFENLLKDKNINSYFLAVRRINTQAVKFYEKNSYIKIKTTKYMHYFRKIIE
jgi:ribosomal protein S18 acetylase RimI-like enzyme